MPAISKEDVKKYLKEAPMLEISQLVKEIETEFGVSAAAAMPMMAMPGAASAMSIPPTACPSFTRIRLARSWSNSFTPG